MPMWNDRDRLLLDDLERQLEHDAPPGYAISSTPSHLAGHAATYFP
jgi:hypothetical protein